MAGDAKRANIAENAASNKQQYQEEIQVDFEGRNPEGQDFHGIKQLLQQLFLKAHIDLSQLSDMLIAQAGIGSVLKQSYDDDDMEDEDELTDPLDVFGITSVINVTSHKETPCIQQLLALLDEMCKNHADNITQEEVNRLLASSAKLGLLINERFVNIPCKISDLLFSSLVDEITRMAKRDASYNFDYYVIICKLHKPKGQNDEIMFSNAEEEIFDKEAVHKFEFDVTDESDTSVGGKWNGDVELVPFRRVLIIDGKKFPTIVQTVKKFVS